MRTSNAVLVPYAAIRALGPYQHKQSNGIPSQRGRAKASEVGGFSVSYLCFVRLGVGYDSIW
ncbi:hypothetical protein BAUCODRAFT_30014 [Baudoinia panamericana UAMH 10762]|uniref:Uncharacterized protein n=1 Tax=Baudoinia panamericana (strain UAMH 10762) TaxID=717646 RepID=M2LY62_BAUPA|nr:uncharacterized protein BAUCODRAFT_30014 [Baudoinia panamericana UAMH 10762]EMC99642.1 hypothetical protein BAUCODRAFT_30014 [Baudoinia panamericana UAMH 10762]